MKTSRKEYNGKTLAVVVAALAAVLMLFWAGCTMGTGGGNGSKDDLDDKKETESASGVDYENYSTSDYVVKVKNNTTKKLVVFKGEPSADTLMGGVPASATNHGLKKNSSLFSSSSDFVLFFVTEEDYVAHKDNLSNLKTKPFTRLYAYYNKNAPNNFVYEISSIMGGTGKITLNNSSDYNVELRRNSIHGEVIGYSAAKTYNTEFMVDPGDYLIFPVFRKFDTTLNEIVTVFPKYSAGTPAAGQAFSVEHQITSNSPLVVNSDKWAKDVTFTNGYAYLKLKNESKAGIRLYAGANTEALTTSTGGQVINSGSSLIYQIEMTRLSGVEGYKFSESEKIASLLYGGSEKSDYSIPEHTFEAGKLYTFTVTGDNVWTLTGDWEGSGVPVENGFTVNQ
ncbi:MAG: hypothetical protein J6C11_09985 [Spirochaetaceae bacterium]|nr:hypothetical protein [Spirochaetaceae bacterium]